MSRTGYVRKHLLVDRRVQGGLILRVLLYWVTCLISLVLLLLCWRVTTGPLQLFQTHLTEMWAQYAPAMIGSLLLLPIVVLDMLRVSNRFAGPLVRLRGAMARLARGEKVKPIRFRDGDYWQEFAEEFNRLLARIQQYETERASAAKQCVCAASRNLELACAAADEG